MYYEERSERETEREEDNDDVGCAPCDRVPVEPLVKHGYWCKEHDHLDAHERGMPYTSLMTLITYQTRRNDPYDGTHVRW
jgi:hypothetical protein